MHRLHIIADALDDGCSVYCPGWDTEIVYEIIDSIRIQSNNVACQIEWEKGVPIQWRGARTNYRWELLRDENPTWDSDNQYRIAPPQPVPYTHETFPKEFLNKIVFYENKFWELGGIGKYGIALKIANREEFGIITVSYEHASRAVKLDGKFLINDLS